MSDFERTTTPTTSGGSTPATQGPTQAPTGREQLRGMTYPEQQKAVSPKPPNPSGGGTAPTATPTPADPAKELRKLAEDITDIGGSAGQADKTAVVGELVKLPKDAFARLNEKGVRVVACKDSVTDVMTELRGVQPRGWPPGQTWDIVPGLYDPGTKRVIVATKGGAVPTTGQGHGSANLVLHEVGHALDGASGGIQAPDFVAARTADSGDLSAYEKQAGTAGPEETYAESVAIALGGTEAQKTARPELVKYFQKNPWKKDEPPPKAPDGKKGGSWI